MLEYKSEESPGTEYLKTNNKTKFNNDGQLSLLQRFRNHLNYLKSLRFKKSVKAYIKFQSAYYRKRFHTSIFSYFHNLYTKQNKNKNNNCVSIYNSLCNQASGEIITLQSSFTEEVESSGISWLKMPDFNKLRDILIQLVGSAYVDDTIKLMEDLFLFARLLFKADGFSDYLVAIMTFVKLRLGDKPLLNSQVLTFVKEYFKSNDIEQEQVDMIDGSRKLLNSWEAFRQSKLYEKLSGLFLYVLAFVFKVNKDVEIKVWHIDEMRREYLAQNYHIDASFFYTLIDTAVFVAERGRQYFATGTIDSLLHSPKGYEEWYTNVTNLIRQYRISNGLNIVDPHDICIVKWLDESEKALAKAGQILKHRDSLDKITVKLVREVSEKLDMMYCDYINSEIGSKFKVPALGILVYGNSGVGKTFVTEIIFKITGLTLNKPVSDEYKFVFTPTDKFYTGLKTKKYFALFDEIGALNPKKAFEDPSVVEPIRAVNPAPNTPPQAELALKGMIPTNFDVVCGTTNVKDLNASHYFTCPSAVQRRFKYVITVEVKPQYLVEGRLVIPDGYEPKGFDDFWIFTIEQSSPRLYNEQKKFYPNCTYKLILKTDSIYEMINWYKSALEEHKSKETKMSKSVDIMRSMDVCKGCLRIPNECICNVTDQSSLETVDLEYRAVCRTSPVRVMDKNNRNRIKLLKAVQPIWRNGETCQNCYDNEIGKDHFCKGCKMVDQCCHQRCHWIGKTTKVVFPQSVVFTCPYHTCTSDPAETWPDSQFYYFEPILVWVQADIALEDPLDVVQREMASATSLEELDRIYRSNARRFHPDAQGSTSRFVIFKNIYDKLRDNFITNKIFNLRNEWLKSNADLLGMFAVGYTLYCGIFWIFILYLNYKSGTFVARKLCKHFGRPASIAYWVYLFVARATIDNQPIRFLQLISLDFLSKYLSQESIEHLFEKSTDAINCMSRGGQRIVNTIKQNKGLIGICAVLLVMKTAYELFRTQEQSSLDKYAEPPRKLNLEVSPNWYTQEVDTNALSISPMSISYKTTPRHTLEDIIYKSTVLLKIYSKSDVPGKSTVAHNHAFNVTGRIFVSNYHAFKTIYGTNALEGDKLIDIEVINSVKPFHDNMRFKLNPKDIVRVREDVIFFEIPNRGNGKNLTDLFPGRGVNVAADGFLVGVTKQGVKKINNLKCVHLDNTSKGDNWKYYYYGEPTNVGDCGSPVVCMTPNSILILGIHGSLKTDIWGRIVHGCGLSIYRDDIQDYLLKTAGKYQLQHFIEEGLPYLMKDHQRLKLYPVTNSIFQYRKEGHCLLFGSLTNYKRGSSSRVTKTLYHQDIIDLGYEDKYGAPVLKGYKPHQLNLTRLLDRDCDFDLHLLRDCRDACTEYFVSKLPVEAKQIVHVIDEYTAINGAPGISYLDALKKNTSAGFPFNKSKLHFMVPLEPNETHQEPWAITEVVKERLEKLFESWKNGKRYCPVFMQNLKDEVRSVQKILEANSRSFTGSPIELTIAIRQLYSGLVRLMQNYRKVFFTSVGIDATSIEFDDLYKDFVKFQNYGAGDFSKFDQCQGITILMTAFEILYHMMFIWGNMHEDLKIQFWCSAWDIICCFVNYNGDLVMFLGFNPSGNPLTVIINGLVNLLLHIYCWGKRCGQNKLKISDFFKHVFLSTYGDDSIFSTDQLWFNQIMLRDELKELNITYTMADKSEEFTPFIPLDDVTFLKRSFKFHPDLGVIVGRLEESSIIKSLLYCVGSKTVSLKYQNKDSLSSALRDFFFYGERTFNIWRNRFIHYCGKYDLTDDVTYLPTYDSCVKRFKDNSEGRIRDLTVDPFGDDDSLEILLNSYTLNENPVDSLETSYVDAPNDPQGRVADTMLLDPTPRFTVEDIPPGIENHIGESPKALINECTVLTETRAAARGGTLVS